MEKGRDKIEKSFSSFKGRSGASVVTLNETKINQITKTDLFPNCMEKSQYICTTKLEKHTL